MKPHTRTLDTASTTPIVSSRINAPAAIQTQDDTNGPSTRAELEQRRLQIDARMAAMTPDSFRMPKDTHGLTEKQSALQARLKKNELVQPDTEVLRQLLLEKAQIAEKLQTMPQESRGLQMPKNEFSVKTEKTKLG